MKTAIPATAAKQSGNEGCPFWGPYAVRSTAVPDLGRKRLIRSDEGEIRSTRVKTKLGGEGCYPVTNLRYLEYHKDGENKNDMVETKEQIVESSKRPKRTAAKLAQKKISEIVSFITARK